MNREKKDGYDTIGDAPVFTLCGIQDHCVTLMIPSLHLLIYMCETLT